MQYSMKRSAASDRLFRLRNAIPIFRNAGTSIGLVRIWYGMLILVFEPICTFYEIPAALREVSYSTLPAVETILGTCIFRIVWVFTVFRNYGTLESLYIVFPITWVITSAAVGISCTVVWKRISHSKQRIQN